MKKDHQENELWTAANPVTGKRELTDPKSDFNPGETIVKLFYYEQFDGYVTIPGASVFSRGMVRSSNPRPFQDLRAVLSASR
jgi:hypothetical protein